jgi:hypothetical protein
LVFASNVGAAAASTARSEGSWELRIAVLVD